MNQVWESGVADDVEFAGLFSKRTRSTIPHTSEIDLDDEQQPKETFGTS